MNTPKKIKNYLKNMKYQLSLVYSKEDVRAIMDIIQEHVNIFLEQNPSASEEIIKQCICEIGNFVQVGIEDIDFHTLKIEELIGQKKKSIYFIRNVSDSLSCCDRSKESELSKQNNSSVLNTGCNRYCLCLC